MPTDRILVLGAGQAGFQLAASLRDGGHQGEVVLAGAEAGLPYNRPPLSKAFLLDDQPIDALALRPPAFYAERRITLRPGQRAVAIDRAEKRVAFASGETLAYGHLVLATGARNRALPVPGADLPGVHALRDAADAAALRDALGRARRIVVIGAGFIGLECASVARARGLEVTVLEAGTRPMARVVSAPTAEAFRARHAASGIRFAFGAAVTRILAAEGRAGGVETADGGRHAADLVLVAVGVVPNAELATAAGLPIGGSSGGGVLVDATLRTPDPAISAIGDCAAYPLPEGPRCLESVQAAVDGARCVAARLLGRPAPFAALPWFWSDQGASKLQIAGLGLGHDQVVLRGAPDEGGFSAFLYRGGRLRAVESVGRPADHMQARRILAAGLDLPPALAADARRPLKQVLAA